MVRFFTLMLLSLLILPLAACGDDSGVPATPYDWTGVWNGPEGTALTIEPGQGEAVTLTIKSLDSTDTFSGTIEGDIIRFTRKGIQETLHHGSGTETAMKWLLDYTNCLIVKEGEGYCRANAEE